MSSPPPRPYDSTKIVLSILAAIIIGLAAFAAWQFNNSKKHLDQARRSIQEQGKSLDADACIQAVISWRQSCEAMASMCDNALGQMIDTCLSAQDRSDYCAANHPEISSNQAVNDICISLGADRKQRSEWKQCGMIIEGVRQHCRNLSHRPTSQSQAPSMSPSMSPSIAHDPTR